MMLGQKKIIIYTLEEKLQLTRLSSIKKREKKKAQNQHFYKLLNLVMTL